MPRSPSTPLAIERTGDVTPLRPSDARPLAPNMIATYEALGDPAQAAALRPIVAAAQPDAGAAAPSTPPVTVAR